LKDHKFTPAAFTVPAAYTPSTTLAIVYISFAMFFVNMSSGMGALAGNDGGYAAYRMSKTLLNAVTAILAAELAGTVAVNSVCPGWVKTDMGGAGATRDVAHGAETAVWLALDAPVTLTGKFVRDREVIPW